MSRSEGSESWPAMVVSGGRAQELPDPVAREEPLELRVETSDGTDLPLTLTMRTPGRDGDLAAGLLYAEGLVESREDLAALRVEPERGRVVLRLRPGLAHDASRTGRTFLASAACGVCGKTSVDALFAAGTPALDPDAPRVPLARLSALPERMRRAQPLFGSTGGIHAAALFDAEGELVAVGEDVGRHNAVDKVVGERLLAGALPLSESVLVVSGRAGFEIAQKAVRAGVPILAAVGAPSSLALRVASRAGMTLVGFLRGDRCNVYTGRTRIVLG